MNRRILLLFIALLPAAFAAETRRENAPAQVDKPYVLLISLDGFRYDYAERYHAEHILDFAKHGVAAKAMIPSFPTTTFPNHYTIVTGLYPAHHGIVENDFWDTRRNLEFKFNDQSKASDPAWWGGTPLWVLAEQQGMVAASYFWPGSDDEIRHTRPTYYYPYDHNVHSDRQIAQIIAWLKLPKSERPHFITMYLSDVDHTGHEYGPDASETREAVQSVDKALGKLFAELQSTGVPVDVFVVSDHGMAAVRDEVDLSWIGETAGVQTGGSEADLKVYSKDPATLDRIYGKLAGKDKRYSVYRPSEIPARLHYAGNERIGDLVVFADSPVLLRRVPPPSNGRPRTPPKGMHGYDVEGMPEMKASFYAQGPDLKSGLTIAEFQNTNVYPLIAHILGLKISEPIDGDLSVLAPILK